MDDAAPSFNPAIIRPMNCVAGIDRGVRNVSGCQHGSRQVRCRNRCERRRGLLLGPAGLTLNCSPPNLTRQK